MRDRKGVLKCDICKKPIEDLTEEQAEADMEGHGWSNSRTARSHGCYHCMERFPVFGNPFVYETYFAGRFKDEGSKRKVFVGHGLYFERSINHNKEEKL